MSESEEKSVYLPEETITNILLHLPTKSIHRCRAVCKAWCRITTDPSFLAAHASRCPAKVILYTYLDVAPRTDHPANHASIDITVDTLPISSNEVGCRSRLIRYPKMYPKVGSCLLLSSCNGVLLFKKSKGFHVVCNPATRTWAELPRFSRGHEYAFYFHQSSFEYRLLCNTFNQMTWCILSTGAVKPRRIHMHAGAVTAGKKATGLLVTTPVDLQGRMHWPPRRTSNTNQTTEMVVFDTLSETFHVMAGPPTTEPQKVKLLCMDGLLVVADFEPTNHIDLWFLEDYITGRWECPHKVDISLLPPSIYGIRPRPGAVAATGDSEGNIMLGDNYCLLVYNVRVKTVRIVNTVAEPQSNMVLLSRYVFKENLGPHRHFHESSSAELQLIHFWS